MPSYKTVRGMRDFLPEEARMLKHIEERASRVAELYGYDEIITPVVESYELLSAKAGEEVRKRMFKFKDLGGRDVALRPEFTASIARLVATVLRNEPKSLRLFSAGSVYRYDEPQRGRYREIHQSNYELMGSDKPEADAEILMLSDSLMKATGLKRYAFKIGHVGVFRGIFSHERIAEKIQDIAMQLMDKKQYDDAFNTLAESGLSKRGLETLQTLVNLESREVFHTIEEMKNVVRGYGKAVEAAQNLYAVLELFRESGCQTETAVEAGFARGLEYYTGMILEIYVPDMDIALGGGGRYDKLIELFGGEPTPAVGVAHGLDRIMLAIQSQRAILNKTEELRTVIIPITEKLVGQALKISKMLRDAGIRVEVETMRRKTTKALEDANRRKADCAIIVGEREMKEEAVVVRSLSRREQEVVKIKDLTEKMTRLKTRSCSSLE